ncbi:hypothetical protein HPB51_016462 [Rhipicephalus microplus]|uniref:Flavin-containing monooxygenase n=1 Tax=Rhipicephalus microplus TaxID=6941 RepID=A0A9J6DVB1_RHIMP|nr:hypothetical protein HPB51_016462 [Rhipicephalus microplus]
MLSKIRRSPGPCHKRRPVLGIQLLTLSSSLRAAVLTAALRDSSGEGEAVTTAIGRRHAVAEKRSRAAFPRLEPRFSWNQRRDLTGERRSFDPQTSSRLAECLCPPEPVTFGSVAAHPSDRSTRADISSSCVLPQVYLSTRRGSWVLHRVAPNGLPMDTLIQRRYFQHLPLWVLNHMAERECQRLLNHDLLGLKPRHRLFQQHPTINDALANRVLSGTLVIKGDVDEFTETGVRFRGDAEDTKVDDVVLATGYDIRFPFLDESLLRVDSNRLPLFKYVFPAHMEHPETLSFLGYIQPLGAINPIAEMQARWVVQEEMLFDVERTDTAQRSRYVSSPRHTIQVDYMPYTRDLARRIGADPSLAMALLQRPGLFWALLTGPQVPYMFRLQGPHMWHGAADAVIGTQQRIEAPIRTRHDSAVLDDSISVSSARQLNKLLGTDKIVSHALEMAIVILSVCVVVVPLLVNYLFS